MPLKSRYFAVFSLGLVIVACASLVYVYDLNRRTSSLWGETDTVDRITQPEEVTKEPNPSISPAPPFDKETATQNQEEAPRELRIPLYGLLINGVPSPDPILAGSEISIVVLCNVSDGIKGPFVDGALIPVKWDIHRDHVYVVDGEKHCVTTNVMMKTTITIDEVGEHTISGLLCPPEEECRWMSVNITVIHHNNQHAATHIIIYAYMQN